MSPFSIEKLLTHSTKKVRRGALQCFRNFLLSKNILREEDITIFKQRLAAFHLDSFMSQSTEIFVVEPFNVSEISGYRKVLCILGSYYDFPPKILNLTLQKYFVGEPFCVSKNVWYGKNL